MLFLLALNLSNPHLGGDENTMKGILFVSPLLTHSAGFYCPSPIASTTEVFRDWIVDVVGVPQDVLSRHTLHLKHAFFPRKERENENENMRARKREINR